MIEAIILGIPVVLAFYFIGRWLKKDEKKNDIRREREMKTVPSAKESISSHKGVASSHLPQGQALVWAIITTVLYILFANFISEIPLIGFFFVWVGWLIPVAFWYTAITGK